MIALRWKKLSRAIIIDTVALAIFSIIAGGLTLLYEVVFADITLQQWWHIRILYNILRLMGARICGKITDSVRVRIIGNSRSNFRKAIADSIALWLYQFPLYVFVALMMGASLHQICIIIPFYLADSILLGWLYGIILDKVRKYFQTIQKNLYEPR